MAKVRYGHQELTAAQARKFAHEEGIATRTVLLGQDAAYALLDMNTDNFRRLQSARTSAYVDVMRRDKWRPGVADIGIAINGVLVNGQHVLAATVESDMKVLVKLTTGLPPEAADAYDTNLARNAAQALAHAGFADSKYVASVYRHWITWQKGERGMGTVVSVPATIAEDIAGDRFFLDNVEGALKASKAARANGVKVSATVGGAMYLVILDVVGKTLTDEFFDGLGGIGAADRNDARNAARRSLNGLGGTGTRVFEFAQKNIILHAYNSWRRGEKRDHYRVPAKLPEVRGK